MTELPRGDSPKRARDLVRTPRGDYRVPETGGHHHLGTAPARQPLLGQDAVSYVETAPVQLAERTSAQLEEQRARHRAAMQRAADALDFELAGRERDALAAVEAELARRELA